MAGEQVTITMTGGGPYGFRLFGGDNMPLSIAKVRTRSKSAEAGLLEEDILLGINGYSCRGLAHGQAMALTEGSGDMLVFQVLRAASSQQAVDAAFESLGGQLVRKPTGAQQHAAPAQSTSPKPIVNGHITPASHVSRTDHTFQEGNTTHRIQHQTRSDQLGDSTYTQTTTQKVSTTNLGPITARPPPIVEKPMFKVSNFSNQPKPMNNWTPSGGPSSHPISAPSNVSLQQNADSSVTMTIGFPMEESKENLPPPRGNINVPQFKVSKVATSQPKGLWTPANQGFAAPKPSPVRTPSPKVEIQQKWTPPAPTAPAFIQEPVYQPKQPSPPRMMEPEQDAFDFQDVSMMKPPMPIDIHKLMFAGSDSDRCSTPDSPATLQRRMGATALLGPVPTMKEKIYADSSFYDDPEHKYPTIEEQIKMARKVAMSLMAPQNKRARGQTMFMRRRQKSDKWIAGMGPPPRDAPDAPDAGHYEPDPSEAYYRPSPWEVKHTWQAPSFQQHQPQHMAMQQQPAFQPAQPAQPQQPPPEPYVRGWGQPEIKASAWSHSEPVYGTHEMAQYPPQQSQQPPQTFPAPFQPVQQQQQPTQPGVAMRNPTPKQRPHTWQPSMFQAMEEPSHPGQPPSWEAPGQTQAPSWQAQAPAAPAAPAAPIPAAPPLPDPRNKTMWHTPQLSMLDGADEEKKASLSHDEFEKVRLFSQKNLHNQVSPQVCFNLANDLRNMKGKGGRLFAKRRAKAEQWVVDPNPSNQNPSQSVMEKIVGQVAMQQAMQNANLKTGPMYNQKKEPESGKPRLQEMIAKPAMTPWEAATTGNLDAAFSHLNRNDPLASSYTPSKPTFSSSPLQSIQEPTPSSQNNKNDYNRKVRGWSGASYGAPNASFNPVAPVKPSFNAKQQIGAASGATNSFLAPSEQHGACSGGEASPIGGASSPYQSPPQQPSPRMPQPAASPAEGSEVYYDAPEVVFHEQGGFSDL